MKTVKINLAFSTFENRPPVRHLIFFIFRKQNFKMKMKKIRSMNVTNAFPFWVLYFKISCPHIIESMELVLNLDY